jgi:hypothetical protein
VGEAVVADDAHVAPAPVDLGAELVIYMQAVRFLTDYIKGDVYYKVTRPGQNLDRARNQMGLLDSIHSKKALLQGIIESQC